MYATNVRNLKKNPSEALRQAEHAPVLVLKGNEPNAVILHLEGAFAGSEAQLRPALAASLYKDHVLSLGAAAKVSGLSLCEFIDHLASLDIDVVTADDFSAQEKKMLESGRNGSS